MVLFFDGVDLPGYGWIFPTSPTSANIGCGVFTQDSVEAGTASRPLPQSQRLEQLLATHPLLRQMLANATQTGPTRAYPLRTDFKPAYAGRGRLLVISEAAGLVNPITGEGIDYALESAEFLATAVAAHWPGHDSAQTGVLLDTARAQRIAQHYRARLSKRFTKRFLLYRAIQGHAMSPLRTPVLLAHLARAPALQRLMVNSLFGRVKLAHIFRPAIVWQVLHILTRKTLSTATRPATAGSQDAMSR